MAAKKRTRPGDLTTQVLIEIRDEVRRTNEQLDVTNKRLGALERRQNETEIRLATELTAVAKAVIQVRDLLREDLLLSPRIDDHEKRLTTLERKLG
jgi:septal ring factor EnvC (AmiA/AmiB activator)